MRIKFSYMKKDEIFKCIPENEDDPDQIVMVSDTKRYYYWIKEIRKWVLCTRMKKELTKIGFEIQSWYDRVILRIDKDNRPKCPICGKDCKFNGLTLGYAKTCSFYHGRILSGREDSKNHSLKMKDYYKSDIIERKLVIL